MAARLRNLLFLALKILFAVVVLVWMVRTGKLDITEVAGAFRHWPQLVAIVVIVYTQIAIMSWRWNLLTNALGFDLKLREAFSLTMIGVLFTVVIPGSIGGDVIKAYYVGRRLPQRRSHAFTTILMDRYVGLLSLLTLGVIGSIINFAVISRSKILMTMAAFIAGACVAATALLALAVMISGRVSRRVENLQAHVPMSSVLLRCWEAIESYRSAPGVLVKAVIVSLPAHLLACLGVYLAMTAIDAPPVTLARFLLVVPIGLVTTVIPLAPGGIGIGQAAFYTLFNIVTPGNGVSASNAFTVYQTLQIAVYLTGLFNYFAAKKMVAPANAAAAV